MNERLEWVLAEISKTEAELTSKLAEIRELQASGASIGNRWQEADHLAKYLVALHNELGALQNGVDDPANRSTTDAARSNVAGSSGGASGWAVAAAIALGIGGVVWAIRRKK